MHTFDIKFSLVFIILFQCSLMAYSQKKNLDANQIQNLTTKHIAGSYPELIEFLSIPNDAHYPEDIKKNLDWLEKAFLKRNFACTILPNEGNPVFYASREVDKAKKTVLFYMHFDGQPVDPSKWGQENPYKPVIKEKNEQGKWVNINNENPLQNPDKEWRIFARSASDDKSPIIMFLTALDILDKEKIKPAYNIKVILDSEEEIGSPNLSSLVQKVKEHLKADALVIFDGPRHISNQPTLQFGCRGIISLSLTVFGPKFSQHSGHYGNYAPNPALVLSQMLASMKDEKGRVLIKGFYDGIELDDQTKKIMAAVPDNEQEIMEKIGIAEADKVGNNYQEALQYPSLNIDGISSGWVGKEARTIVPATATANLDIRLVPESDPVRLLQLLKDHITAQGFYLTENEPTDEERKKYPKIATFQYQISMMPFRTELDSETGKWLISALKRTFEQEPVKIRIAGGSVPIAPFIKTLNIPAMLVPLVNADNNQHSPNENLRIGNYIDGVRTCLGIMVMEIR